ncbi:MAG: hypothetical protein D6772_09290 [Bacteroidetes bacterium]|nr:MAG: hypothetical protein D6772_09290 [Bacteroidota bacterium]
MDHILDDSALTDSQLLITPSIRTFLEETAKWARFLSIVGFVFIGIGALGMFFTGGAFLTAGLGGGSGLGGFIFLFYLLIFGISIIPLVYLYQFATKLKAALEQDNQPLLQDAFENQKSLYKFYGIFTLIFLVLYGLIIIGGILFGLSM